MKKETSIGLFQIGAALLGATLLAAAAADPAPSTSYSTETYRRPMQPKRYPDKVTEFVAKKDRGYQSSYAIRKDD